MSDYTNTQIKDPAIKKMLEDYFEVMHKQDMNLFDTVFHKVVLCILHKLVRFHFDHMLSTEMWLLTANHLLTQETLVETKF